MEWEGEQLLDELLIAIDDSIQQELPGISFRELFQGLLQGTWEMDLFSILQQIGQMLFGELTLQFTFIGQMILLAIVSALIRQMGSSFSDGTIQKVSALMMQSVAVLLLLKAGSAVLSDGQQAISRLAELMQALLPIQLLLMTGLGKLQTAGILKPSVLLIVQIFVWFFHTVLLPLLSMEFALKLFNRMSDAYSLKGLADVIGKFILTFIAFSSMLFLAVLSIQGISGQVLDSLSLRTAKYMAGHFIPVVGGTISGLFDIFVSGALVIRNAVGFLGLFTVLVLTLLPAGKLLVLYGVYHFTAAILQPIGDDCITPLLSDAAGTYLLLFAVVAMTGVFFFFMILIVLAASGAGLAGG